jgi:homoserine dehydrogenase
MLMSDLKTLRVALLGCGVVGSEIAKDFIVDKAELSARCGANLELVKIAVRDIEAVRPGIPRELFTTDAAALVLDPSIDLIIEVMGGIEPARTLILTALTHGKSVVTANKALLAAHGAELFDGADDNGTDLYYEAAVAGAIPILRPLRESLTGDHVRRIMGIVNGTTNYILTRMDESGVDFEVALKEAQTLGYAESDPTADIEGFDAAAKAAILAALAFHTRVTVDDVYREGIAKITTTDIASAKAMGFAIKLLAIAELDGEDAISIRVHPALIPRSHPLASVREAYNAVFVEAEYAGQLMFYGRGAGGAPTASAVLGDLVEVARHRAQGGTGSRESDYADRDIHPMASTKTRYLIRLDVSDRPGVLASVAQVFAENQVSISTVRQDGRFEDAELTVMTHLATDGALAATVKALSELDCVTSVASVIRVEGI